MRACVDRFLHSRPNLWKSHFSSIFDDGQLHLAEISSVIGILYTLFTFKLSGCCAFGGCAWFQMKPSVDAVRRPFGHCVSSRLPLFVVDCRRFVPGLYRAKCAGTGPPFHDGQCCLILLLSLFSACCSTRSFQMLSTVGISRENSDSRDLSLIMNKR